jgi:predicted CopG family antitoxin
MPTTQKLKTIAVSPEVWEILDHMKKPRESFNKVIKHLLSESTVDVVIDFKLVDNELPLTHTIVFQLGDDPDSLYLFDGSKPGDPQPITTEKVQELLKHPKPNLTLSLKDVTTIYEDALANLPAEIRELIINFLNSHSVQIVED